MKARELRCPKCNRLLQRVTNGNPMLACKCGHSEPLKTWTSRGLVEHVNVLGSLRITTRTSPKDYE